MFKKLCAISLVLLYLHPIVVTSATAGSNTRFFHMSGKWSERFRYRGPKEIVERRPGFIASRPGDRKLVDEDVAKYFEKEDDSTASRLPYAIPEPIYISVTDLKVNPNKVIELKLNQVIEIFANNDESPEGLTIVAGELYYSAIRASGERAIYRYSEAPDRTPIAVIQVTRITSPVPTICCASSEA